MSANEFAYQRFSAGQILINKSVEHSVVSRVNLMAQLHLFLNGSLVAGGILLRVNWTAQFPLLAVWCYAES